MPISFLSKDPNPVPCPNGTYSEFPGLRDAAECVQCPEGKYCYSQQPQLQPITTPVRAQINQLTSGGAENSNTNM